MIIDDCFDFYDELKQHSLTCEFEDQKNPVDGVVYPLINDEIPRQQDIFARISELFGRDIASPTLFMRMSPAGVDVPHLMHTDKSMGDHSMMLYLNNEGGTGFAKHNRTGICYHPEDPAYVDLVAKDQNNPEAWSIIGFAEAKENRAVIFDASQIHCALPFGGFGNHQSEARIVMTCFFS